MHSAPILVTLPAKTRVWVLQPCRVEAEVKRLFRVFLAPRSGVSRLCGLCQSVLTFGYVVGGARLTAPSPSGY